MYPVNCMTCRQPLLGLVGDLCPTCRNASRSAFTRHVGDLYRHLGYDVAPLSTTNAGTDVLLCTIPIGGALPVRQYVGCYVTAETTCPTEVVSNFQIDYHEQKARLHLTGGALVSNVPATPEGLGAIDSAWCKFYTYEQLTDELLNFGPTLRSLVSTYEAQDIRKYYIPLSCFSPSQTDLGLYFKSWLENDDRLLLILGDFGSGKTTFLDHSQYDLASKHIKSGSGRIPIKIPLRDFESTGAIDRFAEQQFRSIFNSSFSFQTIIQLLQSDRFVLMLDGFDEMGQQVNPRTRRHHFEALSPLIFASQKTVITCRPSYFLTNDELRAVVTHLDRFNPKTIASIPASATHQTHRNFLEAAEQLAHGNARDIVKVTSVNISPFSPNDIDLYVERIPTPPGSLLTGTDLRKRIRDTYDLEDLATRPILLHMIVQTLPLLQFDAEASPSVIYQAYTDSWMRHDYSKGRVRRLVTAAEKQNFMQGLAWDLYRQGKVSISYAMLEEKVSVFLDTEEIRAEFLASHMQFCSFISRDNSESFRFIHKSFMEYFAAQYIRTRFLELRKGLLSQIRLSNEVCFFLGDLVYVDRRFGNHVIDALREALQHGGFPDPAPIEAVQRNLLSTFSHSRSAIDRLAARGQEWNDLRFKRNTFSGTIENCQWSILRFSECAFTDLHARTIAAHDVVVTASSWRGGTMTDISGLIAGAPTASTHLTLEKTSLTDAIMDGRVSMLVEQSKLVGCHWKSRSGRSLFRNTEFCHCWITQELATLDFHGCQFSNTLLFGGGEDARTAVPFLEAVRRKWQVGGADTLLPSGTRDVPTMEQCIFRNCVFFWWDFSFMRLLECRFEHCFFVCCRFLEVERLELGKEQQFEIEGSSNRFRLPCVNWQADRKKRRKRYDRIAGDDMLTATREPPKKSRRRTDHELLDRLAGAAPSFGGTKMETTTIHRSGGATTASAALPKAGRIRDEEAMWLLTSDSAVELAATIKVPIH